MAPPVMTRATVMAASPRPELVTGKETLRLRPGDAAAIPDEEFLSLARAALAP